MDEVSQVLTNAYQQVRIGNPMDADTLMGPLTDEASVKRFEAAVASAVEAGGKVLTGGKRIERPGCFVEPTVIEARNDWDIVQGETFAPILYLIPYENERTHRLPPLA